MIYGDCPRDQDNHRNGVCVRDWDCPTYSGSFWYIDRAKDDESPIDDDFQGMVSIHGIVTIIRMETIVGIDDIPRYGDSPLDGNSDC